MGVEARAALDLPSFTTVETLGGTKTMTKIDFALRGPLLTSPPRAQSAPKVSIFYAETALEPGWYWQAQGDGVGPFKSERSAREDAEAGYDY